MAKVIIPELAHEMKVLRRQGWGINQLAEKFELERKRVVEALQSVPDDYEFELESRL